MSRLSLLAPGLVLIGETKIYKHPKAKTLYLSIPSAVAQDSVFPFKGGDRVKVTYDKKTKSIVIEPIEADEKPKKADD